MKTKFSMRLLSFLLMLCMLLTLLPASAIATVEAPPTVSVEDQSSTIVYADTSVIFAQTDDQLPEASGENSITLQRGGNVSQALDLTVLVYDNNANYDVDYRLCYNGEPIAKIDGAISVYDAFREGGTLTDGLLFDMSQTYQSQVADESGTQAEDISASQMLAQLDELGALAARIPIRFEAGKSTVSLTAELLDDALSEYEETFLLALVDSDGEVLKDATKLFAIKDNEAAPQVIVSFDCANELTTDEQTDLAMLTFRRSGDLATSTLAELYKDGELLGYVDFAPYQQEQTVWALPGIYRLGASAACSVTSEIVKVISATGEVTVAEGADPVLDAIPKQYASMPSQEKKWTVPNWFPAWARNNTATVETFNEIIYMGSTSNAIFEKGNSSGVGRWNMFNGGGNEHCIETDGTGSRVKKGWRNVYTVNKKYDMTGIESIEITGRVTDLDFDNQVIIGFNTGSKEIGRTTHDNDGDNTVIVKYELPANYQGKGYVFVENKDPSVTDDGCNLYIPNGFKANKRTYRFVISNPSAMYYRGIGNVDIAVQNASNSIFMKMGPSNQITIAYQVENDLPIKLVGYKIRKMNTTTTSDVIPISGSSFIFDQAFLKNYESKYCVNTKDGSTTYPTFEIIPVFEKIPITVEVEDSSWGTISIRDYTPGTQLYVGERLVIDGHPNSGVDFSGVFYKYYKNVSSGNFPSGTQDDDNNVVTFDLGRYDKVVLQGTFQSTDEELVVTYFNRKPDDRHGKLAYNDGVVVTAEEYVKGAFFPLVAEPDEGYVTRWKSDGRVYYGNTFYYQLDGNANHNAVTVEFVPASSLKMKTANITGKLYVYDVSLRDLTESKMLLADSKFTAFSDKEYTGSSDKDGLYTLEGFTGVEGGIYSMMVTYRDMIGYATFVPYGTSEVPQARDITLSQFAPGSVYPSDVSISLGYVTSSQNVVQVRQTDTGEITVQVTNEGGDDTKIEKVELHFLSTRAADYGNKLATLTLSLNEKLTSENDHNLYSYWTYQITDPGVLPVQSRMYISVTAEKTYLSSNADGVVSTTRGTVETGLVNSGYEFITAITDTSIPVEQSVPDLPGAQDANMDSSTKEMLDIPLIGSADFSLTSTSGGYFVQRVVNGTTYLICGYSLTPVYGAGTLKDKYEGAAKTQAAIKAQAEADAKSMAGSSDMQSILLGNGNYTPQQKPAQKKQASNWSFQPAFMLKLALTPGVDNSGNDTTYVTGFELALGFDVFYRKNIPFSVYGVPFYICFSASLEALAQGQFYYEPGTAEAGSDLTLSLYDLCQEPGGFDQTVSSGENFISAPLLTLGLKAGIGYNAFLGVYVDGKVNMPIIFQFNPSFDVAGQIGFELNVGADLVFFTANYKFAQASTSYGNEDLQKELLTVQGYSVADPSKSVVTADNKKNTKLLDASDETPTLEEMLNTLTFSVMERPENSTNLLSKKTVDATTLNENVFKNTKVQLVKLQSGKIMALFLEDNGADSFNYLSACCAISSDGGLTWSEISYVNDNTAKENTSLQFDMQAFELGDRVLITWSEADFETLLKDVDINKLTVAQIAELMNAMNLRGRYFDAQSGEPIGEAFTIAEHSTVACGALNAIRNGEDVYVYYQRNSFPTESNTNLTDILSTERTVAIARSKIGNSAEWTSTSVRAMNRDGQQYRITDVQPFVHDGVMGEVLVIDRNGKLAEYDEAEETWIADNEDSQLYLRTYEFAEDGTPEPTAIIALTDASACAVSPEVLSNEDYLHLIWNEDGSIVYNTDFIASHEDHEDVQSGAILLKKADGTVEEVSQETLHGNELTGSEALNVGTKFTASMADDGNVLLSWIGNDTEDEDLIPADEIYGVILNTVTNAEANVRSGSADDQPGNENTYQLWPVGAPIVLTDEDSLIGNLDSICMESGNENKFLLLFTKLNATLRSEVTSASLIAMQSIDAPDVAVQDVDAPSYPLPGTDMSVEVTVANFGLEPLEGVNITVSGIGEATTVEFSETILPGESFIATVIVPIPEDFAATTDITVTACGVEAQKEYSDSVMRTVNYGAYFAIEEMSDLISLPNSTDCQATTRVQNIGNQAGTPTLTFTNTIFGSDEYRKEYVFAGEHDIAPGEEATLTHILTETLMNQEGNANLVVATGDNYDQRRDSLMPPPVIEVREIAEVETQPIEEVFTDVKDHWAKDDIAFVYNEGLMKGTGANTFEPETTTSRAMLVTVLYRMEGEPAISGANPFKDVASDTWYTNAIIWASANKIVEGYGNQRFGPNDPVTREQMAAIFHRYAVYKKYDTTAAADLSKFKDLSKISEYALVPISWANAVGVINGMTTDTIGPKQNATRAQVAAILRRFTALAP